MFLVGERGHDGDAIAKPFVKRRDLEHVDVPEIGTQCIQDGMADLMGHHVGARAGEHRPATAERKGKERNAPAVVEGVEVHALRSE